MAASCSPRSASSSASSKRASIGQRQVGEGRDQRLVQRPGLLLARLERHSRQRHLRQRHHGGGWPAGGFFAASSWSFCCCSCWSLSRGLDLLVGQGPVGPGGLVEHARPDLGQLVLAARPALPSRYCTASPHAVEALVSVLRGRGLARGWMFGVGQRLLAGGDLLLAFFLQALAEPQGRLAAFGACRRTAPRSARRRPGPRAACRFLQGDAVVVLQQRHPAGAGRVLGQLAARGLAAQGQGVGGLSGLVLATAAGSPAPARPSAPPGRPSARR